ncbi:MAG: branched-chain amino acid transport system substrate-binding protein [Actinomycetota bacterium]|jgi:branched-chain amino acid transport system substrate-binding protein|nr:branched-chain amino acid transport system substrate-binding protein [Actinomycetota bacterium]MDQ1666574.1 branched-chain amino acid transport system substrate-binding protein [Actinomycetota bacterium]MDQ1669935.1 branched-chain amino acid transport system substrate-binding protein [Actinomycetota bacterium]
MKLVRGASVRLRHGAAAAVAATAVLALAAGCAGSSLDQPAAESSASKGAAVKVGLLVPLSGVYAPLGKDMKNGFDLYLDQHDGKLGGREAKVTEADEGEGPQTGVPAATKLVQQDKVAAVVGVVNSAIALGVRNLFDEAKIPLVIANAGANDITGSQASDYVWRTAFSNAAVNEAIGATVAKDMAGKSVYILAPDYAAGKEQMAGFKKTFTAAGGKVAGEQYTPFGKTQDFQPYLSKAERSGAAAVYAFYAGAEAVAFVKQYDQFGLSDKMPLYGSGFLTEGGVLAAQGGAAIGIKTSLHYSNQLDNPENAAFVKAYQAAYDASPTVYSVQAYDAAAALDKALKAADDESGAAIAKALGTVGEIASPRGPWRFGANHDPEQTYYLREVKEQNGAVVNAVIGELTN